MLTCPEKRPLVNPIPLKTGHSIHEIPLVGAFGSMVCHAAFQGKQAGSVQVGGRERHIHTGDKVSPGDILGELLAHPDGFGVNTEPMSRVDLAQGRSYSVEEPKTWELFHIC